MRLSRICLARADLNFLLAGAKLPSFSPKLDSKPALATVSQDLCVLEALTKNRAPQIKISQLFQQNKSLYTNPAANHLLVQNLIRQNDFSTAHSYVLESISHLQSSTITSFLAATFSGSENSGHLGSVFSASVAEPSPFSAQEKSSIAAYTLIGLRLLQERSSYAEIRQWCHKQGFDRSLAMLQLQLFNCYHEGEFDRALELGRTIKAQSEETDDLVFPYKYAILNASRRGSVEAFIAIAEHHCEIVGELPTQFVNTFLSYLPSLHHQIAPIEWFQLCKERGWPLDITSVHVMVDNLAQKHRHIAPQLWKHLDRLCGPSKRSLPLNPLSGRHNPFKRSLVRAIYDERNLDKALQVLTSLQRRGIIPSYEFYIHLFEALVKYRRDSDLEYLKMQMTTTNYPLHCAGIDLAMLERQFSELKKSRESPNKHIMAMMLQDYLRQYPMELHDIVYSTRVASIFWMYLDNPEAAISALEFRRMCSPDQRYSNSNHDSFSLTLLIQLKYACNQSIDEWVYEFLSHSPVIFLDFKFRRVLSQCLAKKHSIQVRDMILQKISQHNKTLEQAIFAQVDQLHSIVA